MQNLTYSTRLVNAGLALLLIWLCIVLYACLKAASGVLTIYQYEFRPWGQIGGVTLYVWMPWVLLTPLVQFMALRFPLQPQHWFGSLLKHFLIMSLLALLHGFGAALLYYHIGDFSGGMEHYAPWQHAGHFLFITDNMYLLDAGIYVCLAASQNINLRYLLAREKEMENMRMQTQLSEAKLMALRMQINPHFLFNTLNAIAVLIRKKDSGKAGAMLEKLSDYFRLTLEQGDQLLIPLEQEVTMIQHYLALEQVRFGDRLQIRYQLAENCLQQQVPALLLQPLVENAIKHGLGNSEDFQLCLSAVRSDEGVKLTLEDNGRAAPQGLAVRPGTGTGLSNVKARLQTRYAGLQRFEFISTPGQGTVVRILIPFAEAEGL